MGLLVKQIVLCNGLLVNVDDEDYDYLNGFGSWKPMKSGSGNTAYATRNKKRNNVTFTLRMHRVIMECVAGPIPKEYVIDHIDGNGLNNIKENLRIVSHSENKRKHKLNKRNTSGYHGVSWDVCHSAFEAYITEGRKKTHLGYYADAKYAAKVYNREALARFGEFASLNIIE